MLRWRRLIITSILQPRLRSKGRWTPGPSSPTPRVLTSVRRSFGLPISHDGLKTKLVGGWATQLGVRQLGWLETQYMGKYKKWQPNHQPEKVQRFWMFVRKISKMFQIYGPVGLHGWNVRLSVTHQYHKINNDSLLEWCKTHLTPHNGKNPQLYIQGKNKSIGVFQVCHEKFTVGLL